MELDALRDRLVLAALPHATFDGWSERSLAAAACDGGMDPTMPERLFPGGPVEAIGHFSRLADRLMAEAAAHMSLDGMAVPARIEALVKIRLSRWSSHKEAIRRAMAVLALPGNVGRAAALTAASVDAIWRAAGDMSHDFSWYTRRATLAAVFTSTVLCWLDDPTEDGAETWAFLKRRLADAGRMAQTRRRIESWLGALPRFGRCRFPVRRRSS